MDPVNDAYQAVALAGATRLEMDHFLERAECVNAKLEALVRVDQLVKIVHRYRERYNK
jgi:hypothetical protein